MRKHLIDKCIDAGVDAVIVQDLGLVKMIREMSPDFPIHGSTQMTITSPEAVEFTKPFDIERVVLGRENNLKQIKTIGETGEASHGGVCARSAMRQLFGPVPHLGNVGRPLREPRRMRTSMPPSL